MDAMTREQRIRTKVPTAGGRCVWISGTLSAAGDLEMLELSEGFVDGPVDRGRLVRLPGHVLPELVDALQALQDVGASE